jgi:hypothetical protein
MPVVELGPGPLVVDVGSPVLVELVDEVGSVVVDEVVVLPPPAPCAVGLPACFTSLTPHAGNQAAAAAVNPAAKTTRRRKLPRDDPEEETELGMVRRPPNRSYHITRWPDQ